MLRWTAHVNQCKNLTCQTFWQCCLPSPSNNQTQPRGAFPSLFCVVDLALCLFPISTFTCPWIFFIHYIATASHPESP